MSTQVNQHLMIAVRLDYYDDEISEKVEHYKDDAFKSDDLNPNGLHAVCDGMNGDYMYIGLCIAKSKDGELLESCEIKPFHQNSIRLVRLLVRKVTGINQEPKMHFITHYR